jgi:hypothetical protein
MILPQSESFMMLKQRLDCVPNFYNKIHESLKPSKSGEDMAKADQQTSSNKDIDFKQLLDHFIKVQEQHKFFKRSKRIS